MAKITVVMSESLHKQARIAAAHDRIPLAELIRKLLAEHIEKVPAAKAANTR